MYFPYLRGRQNELIALRELIEKDILSEKIIPIIEPVKVSPTLLNTIKVFNDSKKEFILIRNPKVGSFISDKKSEEKNELFEEILNNLNNENVYSGLLVDDGINTSISRLNEKGISAEKIATISTKNEAKTFLDTINKELRFKYNIIPYSPAFRRIRNGDRIMLDDKFNKLERNNDYINCEDEFFSDDHIYFSEDGYTGFSDYSVIGKKYLDSGFAPFAVAIHIVYPTNDKTFRIHHFVSDSNYDYNDPAKKFYEALEKLINWNKNIKLDTLAMNTFNKMYEEESYPGLGIIKKLSIMHHIELVSNYLNEELK